MVPGGIWQADQRRAGTGHGGLSESGHERSVLEATCFVELSGCPLVELGFCLTKWVSFSWLFDARGNPAPAVLKVLAAVVVVPAQESAAHAARDAVVPGGIGQADQGGAGTGHGGLSGGRVCERRVMVVMVFSN